MKEISTKELQQRIENGEELNLIDVREVGEVQAGHIPGIILIPLGLLEFRVHELDKNKPYSLICRSGGRSGKEAQYLQDYGYDVTNMIGGMLSWEGKVE